MLTYILAPDPPHRAIAKCIIKLNKQQPGNSGRSLSFSDRCRHLVWCKQTHKHCTSCHMLLKQRPSTSHLLFGTCHTST